MVVVIDRVVLRQRLNFSFSCAHADTNLILIVVVATLGLQWQLLLLQKVLRMLALVLLVDVVWSLRLVLKLLAHVAQVVNVLPHLAQAPLLVPRQQIIRRDARRHIVASIQFIRCTCSERRRRHRINFRFLLFRAHGQIDHLFGLRLHRFPGKCLAVVHLTINCFAKGRESFVSCRLLGHHVPVYLSSGVVVLVEVFVEAKECIDVAAGLR